MTDPSDKATTRVPTGALVLLTAAVVTVLGLQLSPAAPLHHAGADAPMARQARGRAAVVDPVVRLADGRNVALHFADTAGTAASADLAGSVYFGLTYGLYPARAIVGRGDQIINDGPTLRAADHLPPDDWLAAHGAAAVVTFPLDPQGLHKPTARPVR